MEYRNPKHNAFGGIDCEILHPDFGWLSFTATPGDTGAAFDVEALYTTMSNDPETEEYVAPEPEPVLPGAVRSEANRRLVAMASAYTPAERETWSVQIAEANALTANADAPALLLRALTNNDAEALELLRARVLMLAGEFAAASGAILRARNIILDLDPIPSDYGDDSRWP